MKKSVKKSVSVLLALLMVFGMFTALPFTVSAAESGEVVGASSGTTGDCTWTLDDDGVLTISGNGAMGDYYDYYSLSLPWGTSVSSVIIENGVTSIGSFAFYYCTALTSVTIPDSVTSIGGSAFYYCTGLTDVTIGNSVTSIGVSAFDNTAWYNNQPNGLVYAGKVAYRYKGTMLPDTSVVIQDGTKGIAASAFSGCTELTSVTIPDSVTSIGSSAFSGCTELTSVTIGNNVMTIGSSAFYNCTGLTSVTIPDSVTSIGDYAFCGCTGFQSVDIPDSVISIGGNAFSGCTGLTSVTIPDSVTSVGNYAFYNTAWFNNQPDGLVYAGKIAYKYKGTMPANTSIVIQDGTKAITDYAFSFCTGLTSVIIPNSVTSIGSYVFYNCSGLKIITIPPSVTSIESRAFSGCRSLNAVYISDVAAWCKIQFCCDIDSHGSGESTSYTYEYTNPLYFAHNLYLNNELITDLVIPDGVTVISDYAFVGCSRLKSISIPDSVVSIGASTFYNCTNLNKVNISDVAAWCRIGFHDSYNDALGNLYCSNPLYYAHNLYFNNELITDFVIPNGVIRINDSAFRGCSCLERISIPDSVTSIGDGAFNGCTGLTSITIPDSVTSIGSYAFSGCTSLVSFRIPDGITRIAKDTFYNCSALKSITIPSSVTSIMCHAFYGCVGLNAVYISDITAWCQIRFNSPCSDILWCDHDYTNPLSYAHNLYLNDELITDLVIPNNVTGISNYAFKGCSCLERISFPDSVTSIGIGAFLGCTKLTSVIIPDSVTNIGNNAFSGVSSELTITCLAGSCAESYAGRYSIKKSLFNYRIAKQVDGSVTITEYTGKETDVGIPENIFGHPVSSIEKWAFTNNIKLQSVTIPDSVTRIGKGAFYSCVELKTVSMGNGVKDIGLSAFEKCIQLESVTLSDQLESIGDEAFYDCRRLKNLEIPATVTSIGEECFTNCRSLTSLSIPRGVQKLGDSESVGYGMFENCVNLTEVSVPLTVKSIQGNAFAGCRNVTVAGGLNTYAERFAADNDMDFKVVYSESVGNPNLDLKISISDVTAIQRHLAEVEEFSAEQYPLADVDGNGVVNIDDATLIQMYLAEYDVVLG